MLKRFLQDEQGQDLIEYTLLLAFVCLATSALFVSSGGSLSGIWNSANSDLTAANSSASWRLTGWSVAGRSATEYRLGSA
jgi:Flp pilus assembly pilin Flp